MVTGDRPPRSINGLSEELQTQLGSGFLAELEAPDARVRRDILRAKAAGAGLRLPEDCLDLLVEMVEGTVRDIESVWIQLVTTASLLKRPIDRELARRAVATCQEAPASGGRRIDLKAVIHTVAGFFRTTPAALASRSRRRDVLVPRQLAMYFCVNYTDATVAEIGRAFGRNRPAVRNAIARIEKDMAERAPLRYQVESLRDRLEEVANCKHHEPGRTNQKALRAKDRGHSNRAKEAGRPPPGNI
jgi:chromosomal replication initiator protein